MRKATLFVLCVFAVGVVGCSGEPEEPTPAPPTGADSQTKDGATLKGPKLEKNPDWDGNK